MKDILPNFLIVGAAKSGTTSLHNYLNQHPDIFMPSYNKEGMKVKEPRFFIKKEVEMRLHNGIWDWDEYRSLFNEVKEEKSIGEASVLYLYYYKTAIKNIKHYLGDNIKIIIMLRNPVERAFSAYNHVYRGVNENLSFEQALESEELRMQKDSSLTPMIRYKDMGLYYNMVKAYLHAFKDVHIIMYEDFKNNPSSIMKKTTEFLDVDSGFLINTSSRYNVGGRQWRSILFRNFFMQENNLKIIFRKIFSLKRRKKIRKYIELILQKKTPYINNDTRKKLITFYLHDIAKLEKLLKVNLNHWKK